MYMLLGQICTDPDAMTILRFVNTILSVVKICLPLIIIVMSSIDFTKTIVGKGYDDFKKPLSMLCNRLIAATLCFFVPVVIDAVFTIIQDDVSVAACFENANLENIQLAYVREADIALVKAEASLEKTDYDSAAYYINKLSAGVTKTNYLTRLNRVKEIIDARAKKEYVYSPKPINKDDKKNDDSDVTGSGTLNPSGTSASNGNATTKCAVELTTEPDPSAAWSCTTAVRASDFIYPKDTKTGKPLGAWPKSYKDVPTTLKNYKTYKNAFIFPTTPVNGVYNFVYEHNGIDIMAVAGTPVYSPVDGTLDYSEWGHTVNKGSDETAYSVSITMDKAVTVAGVQVKKVFLTHMCGIIYRCSPGHCNKTIKKGEIVGFTGNAAGTATSPGWAPHLHMTLYPDGNYSGGLRSTKIQDELYGISSGTTIKAGA